MTGINKNMNVLYVGFKGKNNASYQLLSNLKGNKLLLTNSYDGLKRDIAMQQGKYKLILMFGIDKTLKNEIRIEKNARYDEERAETLIDIYAMNQHFNKNGIDAFISDIPTAYLCNAAYFHMLKKYTGRVVFVHIPSSKNMSEEMFVNLRKVIERIQNEN